ncbi:MAG: endonuclease domain-containing protein [Dehalococcoidia bacterium]
MDDRQLDQLSNSPLHRAHRIVRGQRVDPVKAMLALRMRRAMTPAEATLWQKLRASRFHGLHFRRQQVIDGYIADFFCNAVSLVVEVDGDVHTEQQEYDAIRDTVLTERGLVVVRVTNNEVFHDLPAVLDRIRQAARREDKLKP